MNALLLVFIISTDDNDDDNADSCVHCNQHISEMALGDSWSICSVCSETAHDSCSGFDPDEGKPSVCAFCTDIVPQIHMKNSAASHDLFSADSSCTTFVETMTSEEVTHVGVTTQLIGKTIANLGGAAFQVVFHLDLLQYPNLSKSLII
ncbi:hypothetical protein GE061_009411 [Apolygus lucorum]|uniref:Uncharacterized protein n=1 Tax=Apolygus lucorum TaxID=248454 RepID=A0A8S9Y268_APOLU|nr:hypothetical protein GE061_009411 [Apolygus lucorum]